MADDFCYSIDGRTKGIFQATYDRYQQWSGRYSALMLDYAMGSLDPRVTGILPGLRLSLWIITLFLVPVLILKQAPAKEKIVSSIILSLVTLFGILSISPSIGQSLYWGSGARSTIPPLFLSLLFIAVLISNRSQTQKPGIKSIKWVLLFLIPFIAGGFSETFAIVQFSLLFTALLVCSIWGKDEYKRDFLRQLAIGLCGSIIALVMIVWTPGNQVRQGLYPPPPGILGLIQLNTNYFILFLGRLLLEMLPLDPFKFIHRCLVLLTLVFIPMLLGAGLLIGNYSLQAQRRTLLRLLIGVPVVALVLVWISFLPATYATSFSMPKRTMIIPVFLVVLALVFWGYLFGAYWTSRGVRATTRQQSTLAMVILIVILSANALWGGWRALGSLTSYAQYAQAWDIRDRYIKSLVQAGTGSVVVAPMVNPMGLEELTANPEHFVNRCLSRYYGVPISIHNQTSPP